MSDAPSQSQDKFIVRLPDGMRDRIKIAADKNNRSMNAEIVATLEEKYPAESLDHAISAAIETLRVGIEGYRSMPDTPQVRKALESLEENLKMFMAMAEETKRVRR